MNRRCPEPDPQMADIVIEPWHNYSGDAGEYYDLNVAAGVPMAPRHARIRLSHRCGWSLSLTPGPQSARRVVVEIVEHLGATPPDVAEPVSREPDEEATA